MRPHILRQRCNERGTTLVIGMLTLALLTVIGLASTTIGSLESNISGNEKTHKESFYAAELGLVGGEAVLENLPARADFNEGTTYGHYAAGRVQFNATATQLEKKSNDAVLWEPLQWDARDSVEVTTIPRGLSRVKKSPSYVLEEREFRPDSQNIGITYGVRGTYYFDVAARGIGSDPSALVLLETIYAKRFN